MCGPDVPVLLGLVMSLCDDLSSHFPSLTSSLIHDKKYISNRVASEGLHFLTNSLPEYGKAFDKWLGNEDRTVDFSTPSFSQKFLSGVKGFIRRDDVDSRDRAWIYLWIRQLSFLFYKLEVPYTQAQLSVAYSKFEERDDELKEAENSIDSYYSTSCGGRILERAAYLLGEVLSGFSPTDLSPKHGPGALSTREVGDDKWKFKRKYYELHSVFPYYEWFVATPSIWHNDSLFALNWFKSLIPLNYSSTKVVAVPKDSRGPRLISEEPLEMQYLQQGMWKWLLDRIEFHSLTKGFVNFTRQDINQTLALESSKTQEFCTIDLSDASDRISEYLVYLLLHHAKIYKALRALRSHYAMLPNGKRISLRKFAPMGSSICFPIEALIFWALSKSAIYERGGDDRVYVYGDDILVTTDNYSIVCDTLVNCGLKVNEDKSYHTGFFRESCGIDAWKGFIVTPVRLRQLPSSCPNCQFLFNWVSTHNGLNDRLFFKAALYVKTYIDGFRKLPVNIHGTALSYIDNFTDILPQFDPRNSMVKFRYNHQFHRLEAYTFAMKQKRKPSLLSGWPRMHRNFLMPRKDPDNWMPRDAVCSTKRWVAIQQFVKTTGS